MKIGLIDPGSKKIIFNESFPHPGLAYIAALLKSHGHQIKILDYNLHGPNPIQEFFREDYDLIGLSATSFTFRQALEIARQIKAEDKNMITVLGGPHVPLGMESVLAPEIDYAIYGEGEFTVLELVDLLEKRRQPQFAELDAIAGLIYKNGNGSTINPPRPRLAELDRLPFPAFELFDMDQYGIYPLLTSRGCPFGCSFCSIKAIWGTQWRARSPENIVAEIEHARRSFAWERKPFNILDDSFNVEPERVGRFCDLLIHKGLNIKWFSAGFRADRVSLPLALKMKEAGCVAVSVGIESANDEVLEKIEKKETMAEIAAGIDNLVQAGIPVQGQFMIGNIGDTLETVKKSFAFARAQRFANVGFYMALPYPKTKLWDYVNEKGRFLQEDYTKFHHFSSQPVFETPEFSAEERSEAYTRGRRLALRIRIRDEIRTKLQRLQRWDWEEISWQRVGKAIKRLTKFFLDLGLKRDESV